MIWLIAVIIWAVILLLPKIYNGLKVIFSLAIMYGFREAFNAWADRHVILAITLSVLFFGIIIGVWIAKQVQITRDNKRIDAENAAKQAGQNQYVLFFELPLDDYEFLKSLSIDLFENVESMQKTSTSLLLFFANDKQASDFQHTYISALTYLGNDEYDEPTEIGLKMESIYDQHFLLSPMKRE